MKSNFKKSKGFTLIELIIVIIILGILAVTVAPKFIDVSGDARGAVMEGVVASIESANTLVHAKALIAGQSDVDSFAVADTTIKLVGAYPSAGTVNALLDFDTTSGATITFDSGKFTHASAVDKDNCVVTVTDSASGARPTVRLVKTGC